MPSSKSPNKIEYIYIIGAGAVLSITLLWHKLKGPKPPPSKPSDWKHITKQGFILKKVPRDLDVIVIGSGMGGLTTAALLAKEGRKVLVLEQHDQAGGNTHTFEEGGYEFDTGLHYVGGKIGLKGKGIRRQLDYITDGDVEWERMDDEYDVAVVQRPNGTKEEFPIHADWKVLIARLKKEFPEEHRAIDTHFQLIRQVERWLPVFFIVSKLPSSLQKLCLKVFESKFKIFKQTTAQVFDSITQNPKLKGLLSYMYGDYGEVPARGAFLVNCLLWAHFRDGAYYPIGGPSIIPKQIIPVIERYGGKVLVKAPVSEILMNEKNEAIGVKVKNHKIYAPQIVSTIGAPMTFEKLVPPSHRHLVSKEIEFIQNPKVAANVSLMSMFIGLEGDLNLPKKNYWIFPSWDHDANWANFLKNNMELPAVFASFSSAKDPTYAQRHPNKQVALIIGPCVFDSVAEYGDKRTGHRGDAYEQKKKKWMDQMLRIFLREFPNLKEHIRYQDFGTAVTNDTYLGTFRGAVYGLSHTPERFARGISPKTPIRNLFLSGQDVLACGICGAMAGGFLTAGTMSMTCMFRTASFWRDL